MSGAGVYLDIRKLTLRLTLAVSYLTAMKNLQGQICHVKANYPVDNYLANLSYYAEDALDTNSRLAEAIGRN